VKTRRFEWFVSKSPHWVSTRINSSSYKRPSSFQKTIQNDNFEMQNGSDIQNCIEFQVTCKSLRNIFWTLSRPRIAWLSRQKVVFVRYHCSKSFKSWWGMWFLLDGTPRMILCLKHTQPHDLHRYSLLCLHEFMVITMQRMRLLESQKWMLDRFDRPGWRESIEEKRTTTEESEMRA
jgi:hypothetical protein